PAEADRGDEAGDAGDWGGQAGTRQLHRPRFHDDVRVEQDESRRDRDHEGDDETLKAHVHSSDLDRLRCRRLASLGTRGWSPAPHLARHLPLEPRLSLARASLRGYGLIRIAPSRSPGSRSYCMSWKRREGWMGARRAGAGAPARWLTAAWGAAAAADLVLPTPESRTLVEAPAGIDRWASRISAGRGSRRPRRGAASRGWGRSRNRGRGRSGPSARRPGWPGPRDPRASPAGPREAGP